MEQFNPDRDKYSFDPTGVTHQLEETLLLEYKISIWSPLFKIRGPWQHYVKVNRLLVEEDSAFKVFTKLVLDQNFERALKYGQNV